MMMRCGRVRGNFWDSEEERVGAIINTQVVVLRSQCVHFAFHVGYYSPVRGYPLKGQHCTICSAYIGGILWLASVGVLCLFEEDRKGVPMIL